MTVLSIAVITMNREKQLYEALDSCTRCELPSDTQFVVIDNASADCTESTVKAFFKDKPYSFYYEKMSQNLGVGGGRNYAYGKALGKYVYFLDDDAVIDVLNNSNFFMKAIRILEDNPSIATLTTQIYDRCWKSNRVEITGKMLTSGIYICKTFCGGSHFLRKLFFDKNPYLPNNYGFEELLPSLKVFNEGYYNAFAPELLVFHCPQINKWNYDKSANYSIIINECAIPFAIKLMMYPKTSRFFLKLAYWKRCNLYLKQIADGKEKADAMVVEIQNKYPIEYRISLKTLWFLFQNFKFSIF